MTDKTLQQLLAAHTPTADGSCAHDVFKRLVSEQRGTSYSPRVIAEIVTGTKKLSPASMVLLGEIIGGFPDDLLEYMGIQEQCRPAMRSILEGISRLGERDIEWPISWLSNELKSSGYTPSPTIIYGWLRGKSFPTEHAQKGLSVILNIDEAALCKTKVTKKKRPAKRHKLAGINRDLPQVADFELKFGDASTVEFLDAVVDAMAAAPGEGHPRSTIAKILSTPWKENWRWSLDATHVLGFLPEWAAIKGTRHPHLHRFLMEELASAEETPCDGSLSTWISAVFQAGGKKPSRASISQWMRGDARMPEHVVAALGNALQSRPDFTVSYEILANRHAPRIRKVKRGPSRIKLPSFSPSDEQRKDLEDAILPMEDPHFLDALEGMMENSLGTPPGRLDIIRSLTRPQSMRWDMMVQYHLILGRIPEWALPDDRKYVEVPALIMDALMTSDAVPSDQPLATWFDREMRARDLSTPTVAMRKWLTGSTTPQWPNLELVADLLKIDHAQRGILKITLERERNQKRKRRRAPRSYKAWVKRLPYTPIPIATDATQDPETATTLPHKKAESFTLRLVEALRHRRIAMKDRPSLNEIEDSLRYLMGHTYKAERNGRGGLVQPDEEDTTLIAKRCGVDPVWLIGDPSETDLQEYVPPDPSEVLNKTGAELTQGDEGSDDEEPETSETAPVRITKSHLRAARTGSFDDRVRTALVYRRVLDDPEADIDLVIKAIRYLMSPVYKVEIDSQGKLLPFSKEDTELLSKRCGLGRGWI